MEITLSSRCLRLFAALTGRRLLSKSATAAAAAATTITLHRNHTNCYQHHRHHCSSISLLLSSSTLDFTYILALIFAFCLLTTFAHDATSTLDPLTILSSYGKAQEQNDTTLHGGEEHDRYGTMLILPNVGAGAGRLTDEQILLRRLLDDYERSARPVLHKSGRVTVGLGLTITQIFELDERNEVLITNVWLDQEWFDEYLKWDPSNFNGIEMMRIPSSKIWLPDIVLYNNAADYSTRAIDSRAMVSSDGYVFWPLPTKLYSSCKVDVKYFPFDEQVCHMKFGSWTYDGFKVDLTNRTEGADLSMYIENGEWTLISVQQRRNVVIYTCCEEPYPDLTFYVYIKRKTLYYLHNVFFPCFVMSTLTLLVFLLPPDSGEKCALGITVMLAFAVFMLTVIEKLPETSESGIYLTVVMSMTAVSVILTVIVLNLHHKTARSWRLASWVLRALDRIAPVCCLNKSDQSVAGNNKVDDEENIDSASRQQKTRMVKSPSQRSAISQRSSQRSGGGGGVVTFDDIVEVDETVAGGGGINRFCYSPKSGSIRQSSLASPAIKRASTSTHQVIRLSSTDFLNELETEMDALGGGGGGGSSYLSNSPSRMAPDHALALAVIRMMERHQKETKTDDIIRDWRRLAETCDRFLFWLFFIVVTFFTFFILVLSPSERLL